ncbi:AraC-type DNA-binding protein [Duganella sacchari]|uniref:AraC-type DNA-binding protein n=1 Tax=Duganella sacchari TaxID=551987 RepID=A0A1M7KH36_9BURK|nr:AraC family transcriptional regulator [Duganella sacchari]SHM64655.1 AraC-type DNA-binding protein [Duganella sacchari]
MLAIASIAGLTMMASFLTIQAMSYTAAIPAAYVRLLSDYLVTRGETALVGTPQSGCTAAQWRAMLENAAERLDDPALGLRVGAGITPAHLGPLGYVLLASSSVLPALERYIRYQRLVHDVSPVRYALGSDGLVLEWGAASREVGLLVNQCGMAAMVQFVRDITGVPTLAPLAVHFVEPSPADVTPYAQLFRCQVLFNAAATRIDFPAGLTGQPLRQPDPALVTLLERQVQELLAALPDEQDLASQLQRQIAAALVQGEPLLDTVAAAMHISGRTLRRKLEQGGWTFQQLLDDVRLKMAQEYLRDTRLTLPEIALLLGYSEQSAFNRAFMRWTGETPRARRLKMLVGLAETERR